MEQHKLKNSWLPNNPIQFTFHLFQISTIALLIGRGWQFIFKSSPFNAFLSHPTFMSPVLKYIYRTDWKEYLTNPAWGDFHSNVISGLGIYLWASVFIVLFIEQVPKWIVKINLGSIFIILLFLSFCYLINKGFQIGQFIEFALQFFTPLFLLFFCLKRDIQNKGFILFLKIATALTFIGHGLYAIGFHPRPGYFIDMIIKGFGTNESQAVLLLNIVGYLDLVCAVALFIPFHKLQKIALYYIIIWGFLTTFARVYSNFSFNLGWYSLKQWLPETLMRFPHFIIPIILLLLITKKDSEESLQGI